MNTSTLSQLIQLPPTHEFSAQNTQRDRDSILTMYKKVGELVKVVNKLAQNDNQQNRDIKRIGDRLVTSVDFFPFKLYTLPDYFRPATDQAQYTASNNWRTFRVRGGYVFTDFVSTASYVAGTDRMEATSYYSTLPTASVGSFDIQVPLNTPQYYFWVEGNTGSLGPSATSSSYSLRWGSNPSTPSSPGNPIGWSGFPSASANHFMVGWVDTSTSGANNVALTRQIQVGDIQHDPYFKFTVCVPGQSPQVFNLPGYRSGSLF